MQSSHSISAVFVTLQYKSTVATLVVMGYNDLLYFGLVLLTHVECPRLLITGILAAVKFTITVYSRTSRLTFSVVLPSVIWGGLYVRSALLPSL